MLYLENTTIMGEHFYIHVFFSHCSIIIVVICYCNKKVIDFGVEVLLKVVFMPMESFHEIKVSQVICPRDSNPLVQFKKVRGGRYPTCAS